MSPYNFKMKLISGKNGKKGGCDNVNTDLALLDPDAFTRLYHPVHVKMAIYADEHPDLKGGVACVLKMKSKAVHTAHAFRFIMLRNWLAQVSSCLYAYPSLCHYSL